MKAITNGLRLACLALMLGGCALFVDNSELWVGQYGLALAQRFGDGILRETAEGERTLVFHRTGYFWGTETVHTEEYNHRTQKWEKKFESVDVERRYDCTMIFGLDDHNIVTAVRFQGQYCDEAFPERSDSSWVNRP